MELDNEVKGNGNSYTTEFRQYDPRLGRWMSLDPLMMKFPWMSPYVAFDNNPVLYVDPYGLESGNGQSHSMEGEPMKTENETEYNPNEGSEMYDGRGEDKFPTEDQLLRTKGSTNSNGGNWNAKANEFIKSDPEVKSQLGNVMSMAIRMEKVAQTKWNLKPAGSENVIFDAQSDDAGFGYELKMYYQTSKNNKIEVFIPLYQYEKGSENFSGGYTPTTLSKCNWEQIVDYGTNCHANAIGIVGYIGDGSMKQIISDDYIVSKKRKIGDVGCLSDWGHSIRIIGGKDGNWIYESNWLGDYKLKGTWDEIVEQCSYKGITITKSSFNWYEKKK
jgi:RHS repeat-associated protein